MSPFSMQFSSAIFLISFSYPQTCLSEISVHNHDKCLLTEKGAAFIVMLTDHVGTYLKKKIKKIIDVKF
jgi:hypothetical protein